jgi:DNA repair protein RecN (Recombination protein N)
VARKHQIAPAELATLGEQLETELTELENADAHRARLQTDEQEQIAAYESAAADLGAARRTAAEPLAQSLNDIIQTLGMPESQFEVRVQSETGDHFPTDGRDRVEFLIAANPGQSARPLERVASGGELSRISLAIEVVAAARTRVPTLVFDEVDTGIGGGVAEIVGRQLHALGSTGQSLCVTHLPQVAAQAQHHLHVMKKVAAGQTRTQIIPLTGDDRIEELARMLGGVELTRQTRAHAADMMARAAD